MKKTIKCVLLVVGIAVLVFGAVESADASCGVHGRVVYVYSNNLTSTSDYAYVYMTPRTTLPTYGYYFYIPRLEGGALPGVVAALGANETVYLYGNASSCPTSGTWRYGGYLTSFRVYANY